MHPRNPWLAALTSACFVVLSARTAWSAEYYASPSGSGDGSLGSPFSLFQAANTAQAGDTVYLRGGVYSGTLRPTNSGTSDAWITFAAYPGELPIFDGAGSGGTGVGSSTAQYLRFIGIVARNYSSTGFGNGWTSASCSPLSNGNLEFINVIAEGNGINGIAFYCASGVLVERSIILHNGNQEPSWSSGVNLFSVKGTAANNIVRQSISFENIDISSNRTDGSGFILDQGSVGAIFENNIGFRNGGSCIRLTNSPNSNLVNNTCFDNGIDPNVLYHDEIFYSDSNSRSGALIRNTVAVASSGNEALWGEAGVTLQNNVFVDDSGPADFFVSPSGLLDFNLTTDASQLIDQGTGAAPATDVGFDPKCLRQEDGQAVSWWQYTIDYDYIEGIGGVAACFEPRTRSGALDIGAYEYAAGSGGTSASTATSTTGSTTGTTASATAGTTVAAAVSTTSSTGSATAATASVTVASAATGTDGTATTGGGASSVGGATGTEATATETSGAATGTEGASADATTADATATATTGDVVGAGGAGGAGGTSATNSVDGAATASTTSTLGTNVTTAAATTGTFGEAPCVLPLIMCGGGCFDTASDPNNCGNCGVRCAQGSVCSSGLCTTSCSPGFTQCGQACVVATTDPFNCGACGFTCDLGQTCQQGVCVGEPTGESPIMPESPIVPQGTVHGDAGCGCRVASGGGLGRGLLLAGLCVILALGRRRYGPKGELYTSGSVRRY